MGRTMRIRRVIAFVGLVFMAWTIGASGAEPSVHDTQGPSRWHVGSTWIVLLFATDHRLVGSIAVRVTREKAVSCMDGDWKRLEILRRHFKAPTLYRPGRCRTRFEETSLLLERLMFAMRTSF